MGFTAYLISLIADIVNFNRQLIEETLQRVSTIELVLSAQNNPLQSDKKRMADNEEREPSPDTVSDR